MQHRHFILFKPYGYLSQFKYELKRPKKLLGELWDFPAGTMAIGRLDEDSEGLLLLTTDGKLSDHICSSGIEKEYYLQVDGRITPQAIEQLQSGVEIGFEGIRYQTLPCKAQMLHEVPHFPERAKKIRDERHGPTSWVSVTVCEGKFRQVRKMLSSVGFPVLRLVRVRIGSVRWDMLQGQSVKEIPNLNQFV